MVAVTALLRLTVPTTFAAPLEVKVEVVAAAALRVMSPAVTPFWTSTSVEVADALTDLLVVIYGAGLAFGIDLDKCFKEVHRSNMSKLSEDGKPIYNEFGKVMKGPNYFKPNLKEYL